MVLHIYANFYYNILDMILLCIIFLWHKYIIGKVQIMFQVIIPNDNPFKIPNMYYKLHSKYLWCKVDPSIILGIEVKLWNM